MVRIRLALAACLAAAPYAAAATAQSYIPHLSFGHDGRISEDGTTIKGWNLHGVGHTPHILSDRIVFTVPHPGHTRGELWSVDHNAEDEWIADVTFRAGGSDRGSGNFQIWYVADGQRAVGSNSIYTVPKFDGLALVVDQHGGNGGMLRGFLSDGSINYRDHHMVDALAFAHCNFWYRNLGIPSRIRVTYDNRGLEVRIDNEICFSTDQVTLPRANYFGLTAATGDNPDSFEVYSFLTRKSHATKGTHFEPVHTEGHHAQQQQPQHEKHEQRQQHHDSHDEHHSSLPNAPEQIPDRDAASFKKQDEQFADLHNRLQALSHQINAIFSELDHISNTVQQRSQEILEKLPRSSSSSDEGLATVNRRLEGLERVMRAIQKDLEGKDYSGHLADLHDAVQTVKGGHAALPGAIDHIVKNSAPKLTTYILVVVIVQAVLLGVYLIVKKRRDSQPKKYL